MRWQHCLCLVAAVLCETSSEFHCSCRLMQCSMASVAPRCGSLSRPLPANSCDQHVGKKSRVAEVEGKPDVIGLGSDPVEGKPDGIGLGSEQPRADLPVEDWPAYFAAELKKAERYSTFSFELRESFPEILEVCDELAAVYDKIYIGITASPTWRYFWCIENFDTGMFPHCCKWARMVVLATGPGSEIGALEQKCIRHFDGHRAATNCLQGGEHANSGPMFLYICCNTAAEHCSLAAEHARNLKEAARLDRQEELESRQTWFDRTVCSSCGCHCSPRCA